MHALATALILAAALALGGCAMPHKKSHEDGPPGSAMSHEQMMQRPMAHARYQPATGQGPAGMVMFHELDGPRLYLHAKLSGLPPAAPVALVVRDESCVAAAHGSAAHGSAAHGGHGTASGSPPQLPVLDAGADGALDLKRVVEAAGVGALPDRFLWLEAAGRRLACAPLRAGHHGRH